MVARNFTHELGQHEPSQVDGAPLELLEIINPYWQTFPPQSQLLNQIIAGLYATLWIVNGLGNSTVIAVFLRKKSLQTPANTFVVNLAIGDFLMMMSQGPFFIASVFEKGYWSFGPIWCELYGFTGGVFGLISILSMVLIAIDRFLVITQGISGPRFKMDHAKAMITLIWIYSIGVNLPPLLRLWSRFSPEGLLNTCSFDYLSQDPWDKKYVLFTFSMSYILPLVLLMVCYTSIVITVWAHEKTLKDQAKKMNIESLRTVNHDNESSVETKIAVTALFCVLLWIIAWTPYAVVVLIGAFVDEKRHFLTPVVSMIPAVLAKTASCVNPIVFAISHPKFKLAFREFWIGSRCERKKKIVPGQNEMQSSSAVVMKF